MPVDGGINEHLDAASDTRLTSNESCPLERGPPFQRCALEAAEMPAVWGMWAEASAMAFANNFAMQP